MQRRILLIGAIALLLLSSLINWSCSKLDTTNIGSDLIPAVDNVHTFADTLTINTTQGIFNDTTLVPREVDHVLGRINTDPLFGQTTANIFMQLKPTFYPYYYGNAKDTINNSLVPGTGFDSVVLCINYKGFWGDSNQLIHLEVRTVNQNNGLWDSIYKTKNINFVPSTGATIGSADVDVRTLGNYVKYSNHRDSSVNQIRIKLSSSFANLLFTRDTTDGSPNNAFRTDTLFKLFNNGIAVLATGSGNGLMYCNLADTNTKLEVHYRRRNGGIIDTAFSSLILNNYPSGISSNGVVVNGPSSTVNNIIRNRAGFPVSTPAPGELYLQTTPGTYVNLDIPALSTMPNRIIHRAELIVQQIPNNTFFDGIFSPPSFLYVDLKDTGTTQKWKPIYFDLNPSSPYDPDNTAAFSTYFPAQGIDLFYHGGYVRSGTDYLGNPNKYYNFNISRYIQQLVTKHAPNYQLRLYAPSNLYYPQMTDAAYIPFTNATAKGRVKIGGGNNPNYRMMLRIVYSNL